MAFGYCVTYAPWQSYTFAIVWLPANNRNVWEYLDCLDAITYGLTYYVRFVYCLCWGPPVPEFTQKSVYPGGIYDLHHPWLGELFHNFIISLFFAYGDTTM